MSEGSKRLLLTPGVSSAAQRQSTSELVGSTPITGRSSSVKEDSRRVLSTQTTPQNLSTSSTMPAVPVAGKSELLLQFMFL